MGPARVWYGSGSLLEDCAVSHRDPWETPTAMVRSTCGRTGTRHSHSKDGKALET